MNTHPAFSFQLEIKTYSLLGPNACFGKVPAAAREDTMSIFGLFLKRLVWFGLKADVPYLH